MEGLYPVLYNMELSSWTKNLCKPANARILAPDQTKSLGEEFIRKKNGTLCMKAPTWKGWHIQEMEVRLVWRIVQYKVVGHVNLIKDLRSYFKDKGKSLTDSNIAMIL